VSASLPGLVRSEWRKVMTTKLAWILVLSSLAWSALNVTLLVLVAPEALSAVPGLDPLTEPAYIQTILAAAGGASLFVLILAIVGMTGEYRHMTITSTFLATPRRGRVVLAKGLLFAALGALVAIVNVVVVTLLAILLLAGKDHAPIEPGAVGQVLFGVTLGLAIYAVVGVSVGALIKNQIAAIVIAIVLVMLVEPLLGAFFSGVGKWLPGGALQSVMDVTTQRGGDGQSLTSTDLLPVWGGAVLLLAYGLVFATVASLTTVRRDIT
jgi:ABC-type transport system involved in multi-copper enzyme maturation permease subunit